MTTWHPYAFDKRLAAFWGVFGVRPGKDGVTLTDDGRMLAASMIGGTPSPDGAKFVVRGADTVSIVGTRTGDVSSVLGVPRGVMHVAWDLGPCRATRAG